MGHWCGFSHSPHLILMEVITLRSVHLLLFIIGMKYLLIKVKLLAYKNVLNYSVRIVLVSSDRN